MNIIYSCIIKEETNGLNETIKEVKDKITWWTKCPGSSKKYDTDLDDAVKYLENVTDDRINWVDAVKEGDLEEVGKMDAEVKKRDGVINDSIK